MPRRRKKHSYRKRVTVSKGKLMDKKINTLFEIRAQEIARHEAAKTRVVLVKRNTWFGEYKPLTNYFGRGVFLSFKGLVQELSRIRLVDIATMANVPVADNLQSTDFDEQKDQQADGTNVLAPQHDINGERTGQEVLITGCQIKVRAKYNEGGAFLEQPERVEDIIIKYAIYRVKEDWGATPTPTPPTAHQLMTWRPWNYCAAIDDDEQIATYRYKKYTCCEGELKMQARSAGQNVRFGSASVKFKKPHKLEFHLANQDGSLPRHYKYFLVLRSSASSENTGSVPEASVPKPEIMAFTRLNYYEP